MGLNREQVYEKSKEVENPRLHEAAMKVREVMLKGTALGWTGERNYKEYKDMLPSEVIFVYFPEEEINCVGHALGLGRSSSDPYRHLWRDYEEVRSLEEADVYVLHNNGGKDSDPRSTWVHMGKLVGNKLAESKWGWADPVFRHPISFYPGHYTDIKFFKRKELVTRNY